MSWIGRAELNRQSQVEHTYMSWIYRTELNRSRQIEQTKKPWIDSNDFNKHKQVEQTEPGLTDRDGLNSRVKLTDKKLNLPDLQPPGPGRPAAAWWRWRRRRGLLSPATLSGDYCNLQHYDGITLTYNIVRLGSNNSSGEILKWKTNDKILCFMWALLCPFRKPNDERNPNSLGLIFLGKQIKYKI